MIYPSAIFPPAPIVMASKDALARPERLLVALILAVGLWNVAQSLTMDRPLHWSGLGISTGIWLFSMAVGISLRRTLGMRRTGTGLVALSLAYAYGTVNATLNYLQFPLAQPLIDPALLRVDQMLGYSWEGALEWLAGYPDLAWVLRWVYLTFIWQIMGVMVLLAMMGRFYALHRMLLTGAISLMVCVVIWTAAPSFGPAAFAEINPEHAALTYLVVNDAYVAEMFRLAEIGPGIITRQGMIGTIALPSAHTFLTLMAVVYAWRTPAFYPLVGLFALMVPAILIHGGHHLVDVIAGIIVLWVSACVSRKLVPEA